MDYQNTMTRLWFTGLLLYALSLAYALADIDDDDKAKASKTPDNVVQLSPQARKLSGIQTLTLTAQQARHEFMAYGKALNIQPLLALQQRYVAALIDYQRTDAQFKQSEQTMTRQNALYQNGISAKRNLQSGQAQWQADAAQREAAQFQLNALRGEARLLWGETLSDWLLNIDSGKLIDFIGGKKTLLQITLPSGKQLTDKQNIAVDTTGNRLAAHQATFISAAPQNDTNSQGLSYYLQSSNAAIQSGMAITAWLSEPNSQQVGVFVPATALLWSMDQAFVYVQTPAGQFQRRVLTHYTRSGDGYFVREDLSTGEVIVVTGAQLLLSNELRGQIPDED